jgi:hypothetical protein
MMVVPAVVLALFAQAAAAPQTAAPEPKQNDPAPAARETCPPPSADGTTIVICTQRPQGYRINPDVLEAKREMKSGGRPVRPGGTVRPDCATVGPAPCFQAGINLVAAALTAAEMAKRVASGQEIGSMFLTDPHPSEYQLYQMAKDRREAEEAEKTAKTEVKAAQARQQAKDSSAPQPPAPSGN